MSSEAQIAIANEVEEIGLATILADLIRQNLAQKSRKWVDFNRLNVVISIEVTDADVSVVLQFERGSLNIYAQSAMFPEIRIATTAENVLALCTVRVSRGIPRLIDRIGFRILRGLLSGELRIGGFARHPVQLVYFTRLMSVNE